MFFNSSNSKFVYLFETRLSLRKSTSLVWPSLWIEIIRLKKNPTRGVDPKSITNLCFYSPKSHLNRYYLTVTGLYLATLPIKAQQDNTNGCDTFCNLSYLPICGIDDGGIKKSFPNECVMKSENCVNKSSKIYETHFSMEINSVFNFSGFQRIGNGTCP